MQKITEAILYLDDYETFSFKEENSIIYFKGSVFYNNEIVNTESWVEYLLKYLVEDEDLFNSVLVAELNKITGLFSLVIQNGRDYIIIGDIIRSKPVFYGFVNNNLFITDNLEKFQRKYGLLEINNARLEESIVYGFVLRNGTVYKNVFGLQAGEIVKISGNEIRSGRYFEFKPAMTRVHYKNMNEFVKNYEQILLSVFTLMIKENRTVNRWIVPLSGGHDSRLVVNYLHLLGIKNVICFSYGTPNNEQARISKAVAEALGYEWYFVEYTEEKWQSLHEIGIIDDFISFAFNGVSTPLLQDFLAIYDLNKRNILRKGDIFIKGHGDFITGSHLNNVDIPCLTEQDALDRVIARHSNLINKSESSVEVMKEIFKESKVKPLYFQEYFDWQERQAKFIVNSLRVYEYFGFECLLPFWNRENVNFWLSVSDIQRSDRKLFFEAAKQGILMKSLVSIPFAGEKKKVSNFSKISFIKKLLPQSLIIKLLRITGHKVKLNEGLNMIFALKAKYVKELLDPLSDFPEYSLDYFKYSLDRYPYQVDPHFLTSLYTLRKLLDKNKY